MILSIRLQIKLMRNLEAYFFKICHQFTEKYLEDSDWNNL